MKVCGIELSGSAAIIIALEGTADDFRVVDTGTSKLKINNTELAHDVISFFNSFQSYICNHQIDKIAVKWRNYKARGWHASGALTFKLEGLIQLNQTAEVILINPNTISARIRKDPPPEQESLFKYQKEAYETAYTYLRLQKD